MRRKALTAPVELQLTPYHVPSLRTLPVTVGGETVPFVLDTGGGLTCLMPSLARAAGCASFGRVTAFRAFGERLDAARCGPVRMRLGPLEIRTEEAVVFDLMALLRDAGLPNAPPLGGLVSLHTLQDWPFTLDWAENRLVIETERSFRQRIKDMRPLRIRVGRDGCSGAVDVFVGVQTPTQGPIWLELDSGNTGPVFLAPHTVSQLGLSIPEAKSLPVALDIGGIGPVTMEVAMKEMIRDGLLNGAFLESIVLAMDLRSGRAWAARRG